MDSQQTAIKLTYRGGDLLKCKNAAKLKLSKGLDRPDRDALHHGLNGGVGAGGSGTRFAGEKLAGPSVVAGRGRPARSAANSAVAVKVNPQSSTLYVGQGRLTAGQPAAVN